MIRIGNTTFEWMSKGVWDAHMAHFEVDESWIFGYHRYKNGFYIRILGLEIALWK